MADVGSALKRNELNILLQLRSSDCVLLVQLQRFAQRLERLTRCG
jgi:hypothetical protein